MRVVGWIIALLFCITAGAFEFSSAAAMYKVPAVYRGEKIEPSAIQESQEGIDEEGPYRVCGCGEKIRLEEPSDQGPKNSSATDEKRPCPLRITKARL